jgi:hypothetical protein
VGSIVDSGPAIAHPVLCQSTKVDAFAKACLVRGIAQFFGEGRLIDGRGFIVLGR